jgi:hypothetical protein
MTRPAVCRWPCRHGGVQRATWSIQRQVPGAVCVVMFVFPRVCHSINFISFLSSINKFQSPSYSNAGGAVAFAAATIKKNQRVRRAVTPHSVLAPPCLHARQESLIEIKQQRRWRCHTEAVVQGAGVKQREIARLTTYTPTMVVGRMSSSCMRSTSGILGGSCSENARMVASVSACATLLVSRYDSNCPHTTCQARTTCGRGSATP